MTTARINKAIAFLEMEIIKNNGWQYFLDTSTGEQVGESVWVCYLNSLPLERWVKEACDRWAAREAEIRDLPFEKVAKALAFYGTASLTRAGLDGLGNAPHGNSGAKPQKVRTVEEYEAMIAEEREQCARRKTEQTDAAEWLALVAMSYANAKRTRKSNPANFKHWAVSLSLAATRYAKPFND